VFSVGHLAVSNLLGKASSKLLNVDVNVPVLFFVSVLPDMDFIIPGLEHRGPTHSLIIFSLLFLPVLVAYRKVAIPYLLAVAQHSLIGDYLTGGIQLFWPITTQCYGVEISSLTNVSLEWIVFSASLTLMLGTKDVWVFFRPHPTNLTLCIPSAAIFLSAFLSFPLPVPKELTAPHLIYLAIFVLSVLVDIKHGSKVVKTTRKEVILSG